MPIKSKSPLRSSSASLLSLSVGWSTTGDGDTERKRKLQLQLQLPHLKQQAQHQTQFQTQNRALLRFGIDDFAGLSNRRGSFVETRSIRILDRSWHLRVYPRGHGNSRSDKVLVSCFLVAGGDGDGDGESTVPVSSPSLPTKEDFGFSFRIKHWRMVPKRCGFQSDVVYGFMGHTRERILQQGLDEYGSFVVDVALRLTLRSPPPSPPSQLQLDNFWVPNKKQKCNIHTHTHTHTHTTKDERERDPPLSRQLVRSPEFADLTFVLGNTNTIVRAHKCVLAVRARTLLELALPLARNDDDDDDGEDEDVSTRKRNDPVPIPDVEEGVFEAFLDYVYTSNEDQILRFLFLGDGMRDDSNRATNNAIANTIPDAVAKAIALLVVADKFGATDLKRFVESLLAETFLSRKNCCEMLLLADSHWCGLLKEASMDLFCSDPEAATVGTSSQQGWKLLKESPKLLSELLVRSRPLRRVTSTG